MYAYGIWLSHGGSPEGFGELSRDDVDVMLAAHMGELVHERVESAKLTAKILAGLFGGEVE